MSNTQAQRTIVVTGATGQQGRGVVQALLNDVSVSGGPWIVRGVTTNPDSDRAKRVLSELQTEDGRLSLVKANTFDLSSLVSAFTGAYGVFAMTDQGSQNKLTTDESDELQSGRNLVEAAKQSGVAHFVFSSTPSISKASGGRLSKAFHMEHKHTIEQEARTQLPGFTSLIPGFFYTNLYFPLYTRLQADGIIRFCTAVPGDQPLQWVDPTFDVGVFTAKIFALGVQETNGKEYHALTTQMTPREMLDVFTRVTGKKAIHDPISPDEFGDLCAKLLGPDMREDGKQMMEWVGMAPKDQVCYGTMKPGADGVGDLGIKASSFEEWLQRSGWTGPTEVYEPL